MKKQYEKIRTITVERKWPRWLRLTLRGLGILLLLQVLFCIGIVWYVNSHKKEVLAMVTQKLNENLNGKLTIESMDPTFFENFPRISLHLRNVTVRDTMFARHQKTLLQAGDFDIALNAIAFIRGSVEINKISISNASVNLFTDANGYTNSSVFKSQTQKGNDSPVYPELRKFELDNVSFIIDNLSKHKLFEFEVKRIRGRMDSGPQGWKISFSMQTLVKSLAFSTQKGSFIKQKMVGGDFDIRFEPGKRTISILPNALDIGGQDFVISAEFKTIANNTNDYAIHIVNDKILWRDAAHLLTPNIYSRLDMFNLKEPIKVRCDISGNFDVAGDPLILVNAKISENELSTPGGLVSDCNFTGIFTNNNTDGKGFNDANSAVKFEDFTGNYAGIPFRMNRAAILNLENPIAKGNFKSGFELRQLGNIIDPGLLNFKKGKATVDLDFEADVVNYKLTKPIVDGTVAIDDGEVQYVPRRLSFSRTFVSLEFRNNDLLVENIHLQSGRSVLNMQGEIRNFLNVYYASPEKVLLNWKIDSPEIHLAEFVQFLGKRNVSKNIRKKKQNADFTEEINTLFDKCRVNMQLRIKKLFYNKFLATNVKADLSLAGSGISVKNGALQNSDGNIRFDAALVQHRKANDYTVHATVSNVDVSRFFYAFDDFGLESMGSKNLNGNLWATSHLSGKILESGQLVPNTILGNVSFELRNGALLNFDPIRKIGKYAFPLRDMNNILFQDLNGSFDFAGEKVSIKPMQVNSSILNMDIDGLYSFGKGTKINISVPLRNPGKDKDITDADELAKRRERGVVVRLLASDAEDGKVKIKLVSKKTQSLERNAKQ
jgi:hypothetical protein